MRQLYFILLTIVLSLAGAPLPAQGCLNDTIPPDPLAENGIVRSLLPGEAATIRADEFDSGSSDNCSDTLVYRIELVSNGGGTAPSDRIVVDESFPGTNLIRFWVRDEAGNWNYCMTYLLLFSCEGGTTAEFDGLREIEVSLSSSTGTVAVSPFNFLLSVPPGCGPYGDLFIAKGSYAYDQIGLLTPNTSITYGPGEVGVQQVTIWGFGGTSLYNFQAYVTVLDENGQGGGCTPDAVPPLMGKGFTGHAVRVNPVAGQVVVRAQDLVNFAMDNCSPADSLQYRAVWLQYATGQVPPFDTLVIPATPTTDAITQPVELWVGDQAGNWNSYETYVLIQNDFEEEAFLSFGGQAYFDLDANCLESGTDPPLAGLPVEARLFRNGQPVGTGAPFLASTNTAGAYHFALTFVGDTLTAVNGQPIIVEDTSGLELQVSAGFPINSGCPAGYTVAVNAHQPAGLGGLDLAVQLQPGCPSLFVDIGAPFLRRCIGESIYHVNYANYGAEPAPDAFVEVAFDDFLTVLGASIPWTAVAGNTYTFPVGDIPPGGQGAFSVTVNVSCDALPGQTHCTEAHIFPDTLCGTPPYDGASIRVEGRCEEAEGEVAFKIENIGQGDMPGPGEYIVVEDVIMLNSNTFQLAAGDSTVVRLPANGSTYRMEAMQVPGHPGFSMPSAAVEGCGENAGGGVSLGFVAIYPQDDFNPFVSIDCQDNVGSFDPNDKQGYPLGVGEERHIRANTNIDYRIRFQNTGTDTAFTVVIRDTLSSVLDAETVLPGAASHPYTFRMLDGRILEFRFEDILLPDSTTNLEASQGFVQFTVMQQPDNPAGTIIENAAAIYFDLNEPVITNTTFHQIGEVVTIINPATAMPPEAPARAYPNPAAGLVAFELPAPAEGILRIYGREGRLVRETAFAGRKIMLSLEGVAPGLYYFRFSCREGPGYSGTLVLSK